MNMKKIAGICILIPILLAGCGNQSDTQTTAAGTSQPGQQTEKAAGDGQQKNQQNNQQNRPAMDPAQRKLFSTFQMLMMLDKADGLTITKEQAQAMLPVAQDIVTKNELSDDNKTKLLANLTDAQKTFITDAETRMSNRGNGGNGGPNGQGNRNGGSGDAGKAQAPDASAVPKANATDGSGNGQQSGGQKPNGGAGGGNANGGGQNGGGGGNRPAGGQMGDVGKQFIELLQNKVK